MNNASCNHLLNPTAFIIVPDGSRPDFENRWRDRQVQEHTREEQASTRSGRKEQASNGAAPLWTWFVSNPVSAPTEKV
jgi:hypothetical protein